MKKSDLRKCKTGRETNLIHENIRATVKNLYLKTQTNPPVIFIHVGKCAGTSFSDVLRNLMNIHFVEIHMRRPPVKRHLEYVSVIRNPVSRIVSAFRYHKRESLRGQLKGCEIKRLIERHDDVESFCSELTENRSYIGQETYKNPHRYGHIGMEISFYLQKLMFRANAQWNIKVFIQERLSEELQEIHGVDSIPQKRYAGADGWRSHISEEAAQEVRTVLSHEFETINIAHEKGFLTDEQLTVISD